MLGGGTDRRRGLPPPVAGGDILRLALFAAVLLTLFYLVAVRRVLDVDALRAAVAASGPVAHWST